MLRITDTQFDKLSGWRPQPMTMPLEAIPHCPCCLGAIEPVAGLYTPLALVVVCECRSCGWLGYGNRPSAQWFESFYASDWDEAGQATDVDLSRHALHPLAAFVSHLVKPPASVCDLGCGFGTAIYQLHRAGYTVRGVEKCGHRRLAACAHNLVVTGDLALLGKFDVIASHHVLEHCLDPDAFVKEIAEHQDEGGIMYLSVPNQVGEPSMGCLLFLPHLHSFTFGSLCRLAQRHGYSLHAYDVGGFNIQAAFKKQLGPTYISVPGTASGKLNRAVHANGQGEYLSWCGNLSDAWFTTADRFSGWAKDKWKPRALAAKRERGKGRFQVEVETPCLFVK
jgi:SAM-dependent methyltransferase